MHQTFLTLVLLSSLGILNAQPADFEWAISVGESSADGGFATTTDVSGNVYVTGLYSGTVDFDPSASTFNLTSNGAVDIFVQKLDALGNFNWAISMGSTSNDRAYSISTDLSGNVYVAGNYEWTVDFDPGLDTFNLTSNGSLDIFVQKIDASGNLLWAKSIGGTSSDYVFSMATDNLGNVYLAGAFEGTADFDPSLDTFNLSSSGGRDIYIQKLDSMGNFEWVKSMGGVNHDVANSVIVDASGEVYVTGAYQGTVDFNADSGTFNLTSNGGYDVFIQKLDASGSFIWAKSIGGSSGDAGQTIATDGMGELYIIGFYSGTADIDPGIDTFNLTSAGSNDIFIQKLDSMGNFIWAKSVGGTAGDFGLSATLDASGNLYLTGFFKSTADFDPDTGSFQLTSNGSEDIFIQKLDASGNFVWAKSIGGTGNDRAYSITIDDSNDVYVTGYFENTADLDPSAGVFNLTSSGGWDLFVLKLDQCSPSSWLDIQTACSSYTWIDGNTYYQSNSTATFNIAGGASSGCDSIIILNLTINSTVDTAVQVACGPFTWIDGNTYVTNNNSATDTMTNAAGCDSVIILNLTIFTIDTSVTILLDDNWSANATSGTFQWIECAKDSILFGETSADFAPPTDASYAVIITDNGCSDTSTCITVQVVGLNELRPPSDVNVYPNPVNKELTFEFESTEERLITIYNLTGKKVSTFESKGTKTGIDVKQLANGFYYYSIEMVEGAVFIERGSFIKE